MKSAKNSIPDYMPASVREDAGASFGRLEAFSGNALYWDRGMPRMEKYKTVKEVCSLTGLTRKHLYYFHHENVVRAAAYANFSVKDNDGYKLYDEEAVEKLRYIALCYRLGLRRNEIRDMMRAQQCDGGDLLEELLMRLHERRAQTELYILVLEHLKNADTPNKIAEILAETTPEELGKRLAQMGEGSDATKE